MTIFGLKEAVVAPLVRAIAGEDLPTEALADRFARASWTGIAEPGDRVAGALVRALGVSVALTTVIDRWDETRIAGALAEAGADPLTREELESAQQRWSPRLKPTAAITALSQAARYGVRLLIPGDPSWPTGVDDLGDHAPLALWIRGRDEVLRSVDRSVALVGARAATGYGEHVTMEASAGLVDRGYTIVSGAAYGIDGMAHRAALASSGRTIAFLAGGVDRFYPTGHEALLTRIADVGAVVSELPCGSPPTKWRFLQRNRLIAASSLATVVLEAGWRSGSLNTAGHAAELGRPLGAVPGPVTSAASAGCHRLIRDFDAVCVTNADEMAELAPLSAEGSLVEVDDRSTDGSADADAPADSDEPPRRREQLDLTHRAVDAPLDLTHREVDAALVPADHTRVLDALSTRAPRTADDVAARAGLAVAQVQSVLGLLELEGGAVERERGWIKKALARQR